MYKTFSLSIFYIDLQESFYSFPHSGHTCLVLDLLQRPHGLLFFLYSATLKKLIVTLITHLQILLRILFPPLYFLFVCFNLIQVAGTPEYYWIETVIDLCLLPWLQGKCFRCLTGKFMFTVGFYWPSLLKCTQELLRLNLCGFGWKLKSNQTLPYFINSLLPFILWQDLQSPSIYSCAPYSVFLHRMNCQFLIYLLRSFMSSLS